MEMRLIVTLIIISALVIVCTESKSRKSRHSSHSSVAKEKKTQHGANCNSDDCGKAKSRSRRSVEATRKPPEFKETTTKGASKKASKDSTTKTTEKYERTTSYVTKSPVVKQSAKAVSNQAAKNPAKNVPVAYRTPRKGVPEGRKPPSTPSKKSPFVNFEEPNSIAFEEFAREFEEAAKEEQHRHPQKYISALFVEEKHEPRDMSYKRPLRDSDRRNGKLPPGEHELSVHDLEDKLVPNEFVHRKHFIELNQTAGYRRVMMGLIFFVVCVPAMMLTFVHCCIKKESKRKTEEEKFMESLLSAPLLPPDHPHSSSRGFNTNNHYGNYGDGDHSYQRSTYPQSFPNVQVHLPPV